jgi:hypothetical protein
MGTISTMRRELSATIEDLSGLGQSQRDFLKARWLSQLLWYESAALTHRYAYVATRVTAIAGGILVPALVGLNLDRGSTFSVRGLVFVLGLLIAVAVGLEGFFRLGDTWRQYRRMAELLKVEGWLFFQLAGPYHRDGTHSKAFHRFAGRTEQLYRDEIEDYISRIAKDKGSAGGKEGDVGSG